MYLNDKYFRLIGIPVLALTIPVFFEGIEFLFEGNWSSILLHLVYVASIWEGMRFIIVWTKTTYSHKYSIHRLWLIELLLAKGYSFTVSAIMFSITPVGTCTNQTGSASEFWINGLISMLVTIMMTAVYEVRSFYHKWKFSQKRAEVMKKWQLREDFNSLKNQVNPSFLFENLRKISEMVEPDPVLAAQEVQRLSAVYRYVLEQRHNGKVSLAEELKFVKEYIYLQNMVGEAKVKLKIELAEENMQWEMVPGTLQLLVDEAIADAEGREVGNRSIIIAIDIEGGKLRVFNRQRAKGEEGAMRMRSYWSEMYAKYEQHSKEPIMLVQSSLMYGIKFPALGA